MSSEHTVVLFSLLPSLLSAILLSILQDTGTGTGAMLCMYIPCAYMPRCVYVCALALTWLNYGTHNLWTFVILFKVLCRYYSLKQGIWVYQAFRRKSLPLPSLSVNCTFPENQHGTRGWGAGVVGCETSRPTRTPHLSPYRPSDRPLERDGTNLSHKSFWILRVATTLLPLLMLWRRASE